MGDEKQKRVMAFGVFDGYHKGHQYFLQQCKNLGDELIVVVARDENVQQLKGKTPLHRLDERMVTLENAGVADIVAAGDTHMHNWTVLKQYKPAVVALGHDQDDLKKVLEKDKASIGHNFTITTVGIWNG